jgi:hypothetical protein
LGAESRAKYNQTTKQPNNQTTKQPNNHETTTTNQPTNQPTKQPPCTQSATYPGPKRVARGRMRGVNERVEKQFAETQPVEMLKFGDAGRHDDPRWKNPCRSKNNEHVSIDRSG